MESTSNISTLETLPDELLLEICKYLLCSDILYSFYDLNHRITCMISQYCHHVSLNKTYLTNYNHLCTNILPHIGSQIGSLVLSSQYSVLQEIFFLKYFGDKMPLLFPNLKKVTLISYEHDQAMNFLDTLHDLCYLVEIHLHNLFRVPDEHQAIFIQKLMQANNCRIKTIIFDKHATALGFIHTIPYFNICQLHINLKTINDLYALFSSIPYVRYLDVVIEEQDPTRTDLSNMNLSSLLHLTNFQLKSTMRWWTLNELTTLLNQLPILRCLSLFLTTSGENLIKGDRILPLLPETIEQFNYAIYLYFRTIYDDYSSDNTIVSSWLPTYSVTYIMNDNCLFFHTVPWHFSLLTSWSLMGTRIPSQIDDCLGYDKQVEQLYLKVDKNNTLNKCLVSLSQCHRVEELYISKNEHDDVHEEEQPVVNHLPRLPRLRRTYFFGAIPSDQHYFSLVLDAAPNLCRLHLSFAHLWKFMEDQQICHSLGQRITELYLYGNENSTILPSLNEEHIPIIASVFHRLYDLYVNFSHLPCTTTLDMDGDILPESFLSNLFEQTYEDIDDLILPFSSESMLICLLKQFKEHKLYNICVDGSFVEQMKINLEEWLQKNTILGQQTFKARFSNGLNQLLIWM